MFKAIFRALFGTKGERDIKKIKPIVDAVANYAEILATLSDEELKAKTPYFKEKIREQLGCRPSELDLQGDAKEKNRERLLNALNEILPEAFAVVREVAWRTIKQRPYDVQVIGGIVLHQGKISEMKTGEGKTLAATLPVYLNALAGLGVHVVTVNDYLARRDAEWMSPIYKFLGMSVGFILTDMEPQTRQKSYACDITYGTNNEFGFDYLRDNMAEHIRLKAQRDFYYCIVDEVDSILIDEARTPLIISGPAEESTKKYHEIQRIVPRLTRDFTIKQNLDGQLLQLTSRKAELTTMIDEGGDNASVQEELDAIKQKMKELNLEKREATINKTLNNPLGDGDYVVEEEDRSVFLTPQGIKRVEELLRVDNLYSNKNIELVHHVEQALKANSLFKIDVDYVIKDGEVVIVDEFTGRLMPGRRYSDGLHQALEAKERVHVARENQTLATITFQNYFRMYAKLSGMTGTADTEAEEFNKIYKLDVVVVPTNKPIIRKDYSDKVYRTEREKFHAIADEIVEINRKGQPILVGTISVEKSEKLSKLLKNRGIQHNVLNAKFHEKEAEIIAQAGHSKKVTIATNMAGRGTDIVLGGNPEFQGKQLLENLLRGGHKEVDAEKPAEFVRYILLREDGQLDRFITSNPGYTKEMANKVAVIRDECKTDQKRVLIAGGLCIIGTERHEARRIDNQLRGRGGRQGDPGASRFYISMEDDLMRLFGGERLMNVMQRLRMPEGEAIEHPLISKAIARSQNRVEARNFEMRKHLIKYDEVMNDQRTFVYKKRDTVLKEEQLKELVMETVTSVVDEKLDEYSEGKRAVSEELLESVHRWTANDLRIDLDFSAIDNIIKMDFDTFRDNLIDGLGQVYSAREKDLGENQMRYLEKAVFLSTIDNKWKEHLYEMDYLKEGINWRSYAQRDPLVEYKFEGYKMFNEMHANINQEVLALLYHTEIAGPIEQDYGFDSYYMGSANHDEYGQFDMLTPEEQEVMQQQAGSEGMMAGRRRVPRRQIINERKVGRNNPCPCGSGKKYKFCHGR